eukprot:364599-Chlamydomonas_euryale.AAC.20
MVCACVRTIWAQFGPAQGQQHWSESEVQRTTALTSSQTSHQAMHIKQLRIAQAVGTDGQSGA